MSKIFKYISISIGFVAALFFAGYLYLDLSAVVITNITGKNISNVKVQMVNEVWWQGDLAPQESKWLFRTIDREGSVTISFDESDRHIMRSCGYYVRHSAIFEKIFLTENAFFFEYTSNGRMGLLIGSGQAARQYPCED